MNAVDSFFTPSWHNDVDILVLWASMAERLLCRNQNSERFSLTSEEREEANEWGVTSTFIGMDRYLLKYIVL